MKFKNIVYAILALIVIYVYFKWQESKDYTNDDPSSFEQSYSRKDKSCVTKEFTNVITNNRFAYTLEGTVYNQCETKKKGYVKIKFIDSNGDIRHSAMTNVNDGDNFNPKQSAPYSYSAEPDKFVDIKEFEVVFVEK
jgi:hypothetical protein